MEGRGKRAEERERKNRFAKGVQQAAAFSAVSRKNSAMFLNDGAAFRYSLLETMLPGVRAPRCISFNGNYVACAARAAENKTPARGKSPFSRQREIWKNVALLRGTAVRAQKKEGEKEREARSLLCSIECGEHTMGAVSRTVFR